MKTDGDEEAPPANPQDLPEKPYVANGGLFVGAREPNWTLEHEQPWHQTAAYLFATGRSFIYVGRALGKSQPAVQNLFRQPWFQKKVSELAAKEGNKSIAGVFDISKTFEAEKYGSLTTLVQLRDDEKVPAAVRLNCAKDILDRALGKPTQRVEMTHEAVSDDPVEEVKRLEEENERLRNPDRRN